MTTAKYIYGQVRQASENVEEDRTITFEISNDSRDRHQSRLSLDGWVLDDFNRNPIVGYQHEVYGGDMCREPNPDDVIGTGPARLEDKALVSDLTFEPADVNPLAEKIFRKVLHGTLRMASVGFNPLEEGSFGQGAERAGGENETYYYGKRELLEWSVVNIGSNRDALKRNLRDQTYNALMYAKRALGDEFSFADIEKMTVGDVLKMIGGEKRNIKEVEKTKVSQIIEPDPKTALRKKRFELNSKVINN